MTSTFFIGEKTIMFYGIIDLATIRSEKYE